MGLYPASKANTKTCCASERELSARLGDDVDYAWADFCVLSSDTTNAAILQDVIGAFNDGPELVDDSWRRIAIHLGARDEEVVVFFVAGKPCQRALDDALATGRVEHVRTLHEIGIELCRLGAQLFAAIVNRTRPTASARAAPRSSSPSSTSR